MNNPTFTFQRNPGKTILIIGILLAFLIPLGLTIWIGHININYYDMLFYSRFFYWGTVVFLLFYALQFERQQLLISKENKFSIGFLLQSVLVLYLLFIAAAIIAAIPTLIGLKENNEMVKKITGLLRGHGPMIFFISLTAGVTEEIIFRGYILTRLAQLFKNQNAAIVISSLLFSALHYKYGSLHELLFTFLIGVIFSAYYLKYHDIKPLIITHFLIDFINMNLAQHIKF